jgi:hypothetical protein
MNQAVVVDNVHVNHHTMTDRTFHVSFLDGLREFCRECSVSLFGVNAAIASGKAEDLLRQRLVGRYGISDIRVHPIGRECDRPTIDIQIQTHEPVTDHARRLIEYEIRLVDERYGTNIHPMYSSR